MKTKIPAIPKLYHREELEEAKERDKMERKIRKDKFNKKNAREQLVEKGDKILVKQQKTSVKPSFDHNPYKVIQRKGDQLLAKRGRIKRHMTEVKILKARPKHL